MTAGAIVLSSLTGAEQVIVDNNGAVLVQCTTAQIASLSGSGTTTDYFNTAITTVGNGTLTAAGIIGGTITRTGPVAAFTDTPATAAQIIAAVGTFVSGATVFVNIKNATAYLMTLATSSGVTWPITNIIGAFSEGQYFGTIGGTAASPTIVFSHYNSPPITLAPSVTNPSAVTLATVGNGTILATAFLAGGTARAGSQSGTPFTDTTDTAANIIATNPGLIGKIGTSIRYEYANLTNAVVTIAGGAGVTVSQPGGALASTAVIPAGTTGAFNVTYTAAATLTMACLAVSNSNSSVVELAGSTSGQTALAASATAGNGTLTFPGSVTGTVATTSGTNLFISDIYRSTASTALANATPGAINGMSALAVVVGTYTFRLVLPNTANGTSGIQTTFTLATAVLSAINSTSVSTATGVASVVQYNATATSATALFANTAASLLIIVEGSFTVSTAGTITFNAALNTGTTAAVIQAGAFCQLTRIA